MGHPFNPGDSFVKPWESFPFFISVPIICGKSTIAAGIHFLSLLHKQKLMNAKEKSTDVNVICAGVGGQGVISSTQIMANTALKEGYPVRTAETHGMAQRGGSVNTFMRFGTEVSGPLIPRGYAHAILAFEPIEAIRNIQYAGPDTYFFVNTEPIIPLSIYQDRKLKYPAVDEIRDTLEKITQYVFLLDATDLAKQAGSIKALNVVFLGIVYGSNRLPLDHDILLETILESVPSGAVEINKRAFSLGVEKGKEIMKHLQTEVAAK